jgi:ferric-dicitrate binding protein FerR (iron transport regulator)
MTHDPQDQDSLDWPLLTRYLTGELSPAESAAVERWFAADPKHRELLGELRSVWAASAGDTTGWDVDSAVASLRARALSAASVPPRAKPAPAAPRFALPKPRFPIAIAAGIVAILVGSGLLVQNRVAAYNAANPVAPQITDVTTRRAQQAEVQLADGSRVILGPSSRLSYSSDFNRKDRIVTLDGDAYFDVVHNAAKPFRVETARGVAEDIGTAFTVRVRDTSALQVVVAEGAVVLRAAVLHGTDSLVLRKAQLGRVLPNGALVFRSHVAPDAYLAWTRGQLVFEDTPLTEVAADLSRWYDADVRVANPKLALRHFSGQFERRSLSEAVHVIAAVAGVSVRRELTGWVFE